MGFFLHPARVWLNEVTPFLFIFSISNGPGGLGPLGSLSSQFSLFLQKTWSI